MGQTEQQRRRACAAGQSRLDDATPEDERATDATIDSTDAWLDAEADADDGDDDMDGDSELVLEVWTVSP